MAKPCEAEHTEREIVVRTWSGTRRGQICDLNYPSAVNHWVSIENWKLQPVDVVSLEATILSGNPFVEFYCPGASNVSVGKWDEPYVTVVPPKKGNLLPKPGEKEWGYVTLSRTGPIGSENVLVELETSWRRGKQDFSLDIRVDT